MYSIELQTVFYEYQNKNHKINSSFVSHDICHFDIRGKLSIIRCDKYILNIIIIIWNTDHIKNPIMEEKKETKNNFFL